MVGLKQVADKIVSGEPLDEIDMVFNNINKSYYAPPAVQELADTLYFGIGELFNRPSLHDGLFMVTYSENMILPYSQIFKSLEGSLPSVVFSSISIPQNSVILVTRGNFTLYTVENLNYNIKDVNENNRN